MEMNGIIQGKYLKVNRKVKGEYETGKGKVPEKY